VFGKAVFSKASFGKAVFLMHLIASLNLLFILDE